VPVFNGTRSATAGLTKASKIKNLVESSENLFSGTCLPVQLEEFLGLLANLSLRNAMNSNSKV
jgi:hypothetical protein